MTNEELITKLRRVGERALSSTLQELLDQAADALQEATSTLAAARAARGSHQTCTRCGHVIADTGDRWELGGLLIAHMETHIPHLADALEEQTSTLEAVKAARGNHPACEKHPDEVSCGWKTAVLDIDAVLAKGETE
jgi:hypothetical protein